MPEGLHQPGVALIWFGMSRACGDTKTPREIAGQRVNSPRAASMYRHGSCRVARRWRDSTGQHSRDCPAALRGARQSELSKLIRWINIQRFVSIYGRFLTSTSPMPATASSLRGLAPLRLHILRRLVEMDVLVDMVDPSHWNEVVFPVGSIALCQLDLVFAIEMVDHADLLSIRGDHVHMFLDLRCRGHESLLPYDLLRTHSRTKGSLKLLRPWLRPRAGIASFESVNGDLARNVSAATPRRERQLRS